MSRLLEYLKKRSRLSGRQFISFDELAEWPAEQVEETKQQGWLIQVDDADGIICQQCDKHCWKPVQTRQKDGSKVGVIDCNDGDCAGLIPVGLERLQQYEINKTNLCPKKKDKDREIEIPLNVRVGNVVIKHQNANSEEIARMVGSTAGSVRTTPAWEMRKRLRQRYDTTKGWKDSEGNYDAYDSSEIKPEHWDIYEMFQKYKSDKKREYPSIDFIAKKLNIAHTKAKELLKEAQSILDFTAEETN